MSNTEKKYSIYLINRLMGKPVIYTNHLLDNPEFEGIQYIDDDGFEWYIPFSNIAGIRKKKA